MESPDLIESITNENDYVQDPLKPIVFGGVIFENLEAGADLNYTLRLATEHVQRLSNFLFMPYSFSGPQRNGEEYAMFCSLQTLIDLAFIQISTGETLLLDSNASSPLAFISQLKWVGIMTSSWLFKMVKQEMFLDGCRAANGLSPVL